MKRLQAFLSAVILMFACKSFAQTINGQITNSANKKISFASVSLHRLSDSGLVRTAVSDSTGFFNFMNVYNGSYFIQASAVGYSSKSSTAFVVNNNIIKLQPISLPQNDNTLQAVKVVAAKPFFERKTDRSIVNVAGSSIAAGATVLEVLEKSPGVVVDKDGNIAMNGKGGVQIMIDGKQTFMSSEDLAQLLRSMQSSQVDVIELITNPSSRYDASGNAGIINIKTKKSITRGTNGSVTIGGGYGTGFKLNNSLNLNNRSEKWNVYGNYNEGNNKTGRLLKIDRQSSGFGASTFFKQYQLEERFSGNHFVKAGADYFINKRNTIGVLVNAYYNKGRVTAENNTYIGSDDKVTDSSITVYSNNSSRYNNFAVNLNYKTLIDSAGQELTFDIDYSKYFSKNITRYDNYFYLNGGSVVREPYFNRNMTPSNIQIKASRVDYVNPSVSGVRIEAGLKSSHVHTDNNLHFEELRNDKWINNAYRSNHFIYDEVVNAAYVTGNKSFEKTSVQFGLRAEHTLSKGNSITENKIVKRSYLDLFPSLFINHSVSQDFNFNFSYSRRIDRPQYDALNPFVYYLDQYTFQKGNPFLRAEYTHSMEMGSIWRKKYTANIRYAITSDIITDVILPDTTGKGLYQTSTNVSNAYFTSININAPVTITKWWSSNQTVTAFNNRYQTASLEGLALQAGKTSFYASTMHNFSLPKGIAAEVFANYRSAMVYGSFHMGSEYGVDLGLNKNLVSKKANIKLSVSDVFNTRRQNIRSTLPNVQYQLRQKPETRIVRLTISYRFGSNNIKGARNRSTALESEQNRIKQ